jgi:hypothetical protein
MVGKGDDEKFKGLKAAKNPFQSVRFGLICMWVLLACIS